MVRLFAALFLLLLSISPAMAQDQAPPTSPPATTGFEIRAVWLNRMLMKKGPDAIKQFMDDASKRGITHVFPNFWFHGCVIYPDSNLAPQHPDFGGWDPMKVVVEEAHARGIKVWPWGEYGFFTHFNRTLKNEDCGWLLTHHPDWKIQDEEGNTGLLNEKMGVMHFSMNPANPDACDFLIKLHLDIARRYDIDGINTDRIRYMNEKWGHDPLSKRLFLLASEQNAQLSFDDWRKGIITDFQKKFAEQWRAENPKRPISAAVNPPSMYQSKFQYFDEWMKEGSLDYAVPMIYGNLNLFKSELQKTMEMVPPGSRVVAGIDAGAGETEFSKQVEAAKALGAVGICIWNDEAWQNMKYSFTPASTAVDKKTGSR
ncbi:family 10 glycosylhydrolase [Candidatus Sumerlaeota bacterium]|nr:family 10 glycosylhydrolase [Candidatus Sumerlaeota bacterium]